MQNYLLIFLLIASPAVQAYGNRDNPLGSPLTIETLLHHTPPKTINVAELLMKRGLANKDQVSDEILATIGIKSGLSFAGKRVRLGKLPIEDADLYQMVQEKIALSIPEEYERPILDIIFLTSDTKPLTPDHTIGIVGGTGPLSDASVMHGLGERFKKMNRQGLSHHLHLLSMPPPRAVFDQALGGLAYVNRLIKFRRLSYKTYLLASNTAHVNYANFARIMGDEYAFNMVTHIADKVQLLMQENATAANQELLIFGTTQAWEARLYPKLFKKRGITTISPHRDDQALVQEYINHVKEGRNSPEAIAGFMEVFHKYYRNTQQSIIFACTELPLGLQEHIAGESTATPTFAGAPLYNTEALMIDALWSLAAAGGV